MATTGDNHNRHDDRHDDERRASPLGAYVATVGALILLISVWLDWVTKGPGDSEKLGVDGYEADGVIPLMGYLALGFALALLYATVRADRRQHRGLSLASFAVGLASLLWIISFLIDPISTSQYNENVSTEIGPYIAALGALLWTVGSFLLAKEKHEGDDDDSHRVAAARPVATTQHTDTRRVDPEVHRTTGHDVHGTTGHDVHGTSDHDIHNTTGNTYDNDHRNPGGDTGTSGTR